MLRCYSSSQKHDSSREILTSPTSVEEFFEPEYCKMVRWKELKPRSNYCTRRKSLDLAEETTPGHRVNAFIVDDADIEGPRDEATLKGTACLKKVLVVVVAVEVVGNHS